MSEKKYLAIMCAHRSFCAAKIMRLFSFSKKNNKKSKLFNKKTGKICYSTHFAHFVCFLFLILVPISQRFRHAVYEGTYRRVECL